MAWERASSQVRKQQGLVGSDYRVTHLNKEGLRGQVAQVIEHKGRRNPERVLQKWLLKWLCRLRWKAREVKSYAPNANSLCRFTVRSVRYAIMSFTWIISPKSRKSMCPPRTFSPSMKSSKKDIASLLYFQRQISTVHSTPNITEEREPPSQRSSKSSRVTRSIRLTPSTTPSWIRV
jgi:hypothetical protein